MAVGGRVLLASYTSRLPRDGHFFVVSILSCSHVFGLYQCCFDAKDPISFYLGKGNNVLPNTVFAARDSRLSSIMWKHIFFMPRAVFLFMSRQSRRHIHMGESPRAFSDLFLSITKEIAFQSPQAQARRRKKRSGSGPFPLHSQPRRSRKVGH